MNSTQNQDQKPSKLTQFALLVYLAIFLYIIIDYEEVIELFKKFTEWIEHNPKSAVFAIILTYIVVEIVLGPTKPLHIAFGYAYAVV